jgi:hypothetical protein
MGSLPDEKRCGITRVRPPQPEGGSIHRCGNSKTTWRPSTFFRATTSTCNGDVCYFDFGYPTSLLAKLGLASKINLGVRLPVHQGRLDAIILDVV